MLEAIISNNIRFAFDGNNDFRSVRHNGECGGFYGHDVVRVGFFVQRGGDSVFTRLFAFFAAEFHIVELFRDTINHGKALDSVSEFGVTFTVHFRSFIHRQSDRLRSNREGLFQNAAKVSDTGDRHGGNASFHVIRVAYDIIRLSGQGFAAFEGNDHSRRQRSAAINEFAFGKRGFVESDVSLPVGLESLVARLIIGNLDRFRRAVYAGAAPASEHIPFLKRVVELERFGIFGEEHLAVGSSQGSAIEVVRNKERIVERVVNPGNAFFHPCLHVVDFALVRQAFFITSRVRMDLLAKNIPLHEVALCRERVTAGQGQEHVLHRSVQSFLLFVPAVNHVSNKQGIFEHASRPDAVFNIPSSDGSNFAIAIVTESNVEIPNRAVMQLRIGRIVEFVNRGGILCVVVAGDFVHKEPVNNGLFVEIFTPAIHGILEIFTVQGVFSSLNNSPHMFLDVFGHFVGVLQSNRSFCFFRLEPKLGVPPIVDFHDKAAVVQVDYAIAILVRIITVLNILFSVIRNVLDLNTTGTDGIAFTQDVVSLINALPHNFYRLEGGIPFRVKQSVRKQGRIDVTQQCLVRIIRKDAPFFCRGMTEQFLVLVEKEVIPLLLHLPGLVTAASYAFFLLAVFHFLECVLKARAIFVDKPYATENILFLCNLLHRDIGVDVQHRESRVGHHGDLGFHAFLADSRDAEVVSDLLLFEGPDFQEIISCVRNGFAIVIRAVGRLVPLVRDITAFLLNLKKERNSTVLFQNGYRGRLRNNGKRVLIVLRQSHCHRRQRHEKQDR